ncbi:MAG TPA: family 20 glycosylhydrolase [Verrucomicrobiae bacterium]|nr:family 20 glycosylhydrolase [Verrucomicrobiae bacterium]
MNLNLLPCPRSLKMARGTFTLSKETVDFILGSTRIGFAPDGVPRAGIHLNRDESSGARDAGACQSEFYAVTVSKTGIKISFREPAGLRAAMATLRQLLRQYGCHPPCLRIRDWPDFPRRGVMVDISRGRVPRLKTLLDLAEKLADFKINELQFYTEHTFAYRKYGSVWRSWGALTATEIRVLDAHCRELGMDLVPNQNSFGHLRYFLEHPEVKKLAEVSASYPDVSGEFVRRPTTLAPNHPGTLPFLRQLYDELLPNFSSKFFNVGCDETWDLGRGQSKPACERLGKGRVYLDFLKKINREVSARGKTMMFWGDIILKYPSLISELPKSAIALNWGYEAKHPFGREAAQFAKSKIPFYVCPGTSTWQTLVGRHDNALANLRAAARAGRKFGAVGYLICDWGDGGHPNPLAVSWPMFVAGASVAWNSQSFEEERLVPVLAGEIFGNQKIARVAIALGLAHKKLGAKAVNETPLGTVIAAPKPEDRELFCRNGLKWFLKIKPAKIRAALGEIEKLRAALLRARAKPGPEKILARELDLAARMAAQSCHFMLWQQAVAAGNLAESRRLAGTGVRKLKQLQKDFTAYWPLRNKVTPKHCSAFLQWRINDYHLGTP